MELNKEKVIEEYIAKADALVDAMDISRDNKNCILAIGRINGSFFAQAKGRGIDLANVLVRIMAKNERLYESIKDAVDAMEKHGDYIREMVDNHYNTTERCEQVDN